VECQWYEFVKWFDSGAKFPGPKECYRRWLGPSLDIGPAMTAKIVKSNGQVIHLSSYHVLNESEKTEPHELKEQESFDTRIHEIVGQPISQKTLKLMDWETPTYLPYEEVDEGLAADNQIDSHGLEGTQEPTPEMDTYVGAQVNSPVDGEFRSVTVKRRVSSKTGQVIGTYNSNPILDTRSYDVVFEDDRKAS